MLCVLVQLNYNCFFSDVDKKLRDQLEETTNQMWVKHLLHSFEKSVSICKANEKNNQKRKFCLLNLSIFLLHSAVSLNFFLMQYSKMHLQMQWMICPFWATVQTIRTSWKINHFFSIYKSHSKVTKMQEILIFLRFNPKENLILIIILHFMLIDLFKFYTLHH